MKEYIIKINGNQYAVSVQSNDDTSAKVVVNGSEFNVEHEKVEAKKTGSSKPTSATTTATTAPVVKTPAVAAQPNAKESIIKSPLPGIILSISVKEGDTIKAGDRLLMLEAMKMENNIDADKDGVVTKLHVQTGESVLEGAVLVTIQ